MKSKNLFSLVITIVAVTAVSVVLVLLASGYRLDPSNGTIQGTGIISVSSLPTGGLVYINGVPKDATNTSITQLKPGSYIIEIEKEGYHKWVKDLEVRKELVTQGDALLIPQYPSFKPLTYTGVEKPLVSPDGQRVIYTVSEGNLAGIWELSFEERPFNIARKANQLIENTEQQNYSLAKITWSPDSTEILIESENQVELYNFNNRTLETLDNEEETLALWKEQELLADDEKLLNLASETLVSIGQLQNPTWSPNAEYILHTSKTDNETTYNVFVVPKTQDNISEQPTPIIESKIGKTPLLRVENNTNHSVRWFPDSKHLLFSHEIENGQTVVEIIEVDGDNQTQIFTGQIENLTIYPTPNGSKVVILTTFSTGDSLYNLYALELR